MVDFFEAMFKIFGVLLVLYSLQLLYRAQGCSAYDFRHGKCAEKINHGGDFHIAQDGFQWRK